jgi:predicted permease
MLTILKVIEARIRGFFDRPVLDREFNDEVESHLAMLSEQHVRWGLSPEAARRAAALELGPVTQLREAHREARGLPFLDTLFQDLRYTFRALRHEPGFTIFAVLIVGLGIGASSTIFSLMDAFLLRPLLPFRDPARLVWLANLDVDEEGLSGQTVPVFHYTDLREQSRTFSDIAGYYAGFATGDTKLTGGGEPLRLTSISVTGNFFSVLGVATQLGRLFRPEECKPRWWPYEPKVALLSHRLWVSRFSADPAVVGRQLTLNDKPVMVVGVLPASFDFGTVFAPGMRVDLYYPFPLTAEAHRWGNTLAMIGRLAPDATLQQAQAEMRILGPRIRRRDPDRNFRPVPTPLAEHVSGRLRHALFVLASAVGAVMLIVCANLSNLLLTRTARRQKEMAIRAALGAGRLRLIRQMLTESLVLSCCGAGLGLILAVGGTKFLAHQNVFRIPLLEGIGIDAGVLAFTLLMAVATGLIFGLVPALEAPSGAIHESLKDGSRGATQGRRGAWIRAALVVSEIAFACVLLMAAGLLIRSFLHVLDLPLGFHPERALAMRIDPGPEYATQAQRNAYYNEVLRRVRSVRGVEAAGLTDILPFSGSRTWTLGAKGHVYSKAQPPPPSFIRVVSDGYFRAMGIPLEAGREFTASDTASSQPVIIINETLARFYWPGRNAVGQIILGGGNVDRRVVGVVHEVRHLALEQSGGNEVYMPIRQTDDYSAVELVVRATLDPGSVPSAIRAALRPIEPNLPGNSVQTLQNLVDAAVAPRRFLMVLLAGFSVFALILASLGIYAVISYSVSQRTHELGIRIALGASAGKLQASIILQTLRLTGFGLLIGFAAAEMLSRTIGSLLYGVTANDPATFLWMLAILTAVAATAGYLPARRVSRIDPTVALRVN